MECFRRGSRLQAIAAECFLQGQVLSLDPGPRFSINTTASFTLATIEQELCTVLGHLQSLEEIPWSPLAGPDVRCKASGVEPETQCTV